MSTEECMSPAALAWKKFDLDVPDPLLRAASGAFAVVACADGELAEAEIAMFLDMVKDNHAFADVDLASLERQFRDLATAMLDDFEAGLRLAFEAVERVKDDDKHTALVVSAAQIAIVADEKLKPSEEKSLCRLCELLGLDPALY